MKKPVVFHLRMFILTVVAAALLAAAGLYRTHMDTDIIKYLPRNDPVLADAGYVFYNHPIQDRIVMDIHLPEPNPDKLSDCAAWAENRMKQSGLFKSVGMKEMRDVFLDVISHVLRNLPVLFTEADLYGRIAPKLEPERIQSRLETVYSDLFNLESLGQAEMISQDPLGLKDLILARLSALAPGDNIRLYNGRIISSDNRRLLQMAVPVTPGTDTEFASRLSDFFNDLIEEAGLKFPDATLTPMGAYRAALDNELTAKSDVRKAIFLATAGVALLLVLTFSRPFIGLFAFVPALAGTAAAFFVFSLFHRSVSVMVLGFGGAIISIAVDHGVAYLLFMDQPRKTSGREAAREIRAVGLLSTLTTVTAFGVLCFSDFPIFSQLGLFTALGLAFSFIFVHTVFPRIFISMPPSERRVRPLGNIAARFLDNKPALWIVLIFAGFMAVCARPDFNVDLTSMNTVTTETREAEKTLTKTWGERIFGKIYLITVADDPKSLQNTADMILKKAERDISSNVLDSVFLSSMLFPGEFRRKENLAAWKTFWTPERTARLKQTLDKSAAETGFAHNAFDPFYKLLSPGYEPPEWSGVPEKFFRLAGITRNSGESGWIQFSEMTPGPAYDPLEFRRTYGAFARIFDPQFFSTHLGGVLFSAFTRLLVIISITAAGLLFLFFLDPRLTAAALAPVCFAMICTLGTLNVMGRPIDIPGVMLSIIILGMGIDYSLFIVMSYRRYGEETHPAFEKIRTAVFMAGMSTSIGFGSLCFADHSLLRSAGFTSLLGIGYSLIGAFVLLPPLMRRLMKDGDGRAPETAGLHQRVIWRYRNLETYPRIFARCKLKWDPMFKELPEITSDLRSVNTIVDIGCGYGVPGCWFLERFPDARLWGMDHNSERIRIAARAMGQRAVLQTGTAPHIDDAPDEAGAVLLLDIIHYLSDRDLDSTLIRAKQHLGSEGRLIVRAVVAPRDRNYSWMWKLEQFQMKQAGHRLQARSADQINDAISGAGFEPVYTTPSPNNRELVWFVGVKN